MVMLSTMTTNLIPIEHGDWLSLIFLIILILLHWVEGTYLSELVPYCIAVNNGAIESVWDIDEIKVLDNIAMRPLVK